MNRRLYRKHDSSTKFLLTEKLLMTLWKKSLFCHYNKCSINILIDSTIDSVSDKELFNGLNQTRIIIEINLFRIANETIRVFGSHSAFSIFLATNWKSRNHSQEWSKVNICIFKQWGKCRNTEFIISPDIAINIFQIFIRLLCISGSPRLPISLDFSFLLA